MKLITFEIFVVLRISIANRKFLSLVAPSANQTTSSMGDSSLLPTPPYQLPTRTVLADRFRSNHVPLHTASPLCRASIIGPIPLTLPPLGHVSQHLDGNDKRMVGVAVGGGKTTMEEEHVTG